MMFVSDYMDDHKEVDVIYLDFQKAFDKVPHKCLIAKLKSFGIIDKVYTWIESWLLGRKQRVILNILFLSGNQLLVVCFRVQY